VTLKSLNQYGKGFQLKVLGSLLTDRKFITNVRDVIKEDYFDSDAHKWVIKQVIEYFDKYNTNITMDVLKVELQKVSNEVLRVALKEELRNSYQASQDDLEYVQEEFTTFCRNQEMKAAILESADLLKDGDYDGIRNMIERAMKAGTNKNLGHDYNKDVETRYREDYRPTIPTPWPVLNQGIQGGWGPGDLIIMFGNPGGGKCVDYNTEIEIEHPQYHLELENNIGKTYTLTFEPWEEFNVNGVHLFGWQVQNLLDDFTLTETRNNSKVKIGNLFAQLGVEPYQNNTYPVTWDLKVNTPYGYKPIDVLFTTEKQTQITTYFTNGKTLTTSNHHLLRRIDGEWIKVKDINIGDRIKTRSGITKVRKKIKKDKQKVLYDMTVRDVHCYYSNEVVSHNSWTMVAAAAHAVKMGYNVNFYTLELGEDYVGKRFDCYFTGYSIDEVNKHRKHVQDQIDNLKGKLIVKEYPPKTASINTIKAHIQKCTDMDHKPDLVVIDYVDYLKAPSRGKFNERKDEIDDVFIATKGLAKELKIPVLTPSQVNRMGARDTVIEGDKAAGSYDKLMVADICLSLSRQKEDKVLGTGRVHMMKNRYGQDGMTYDVKMNTDNGFIEFKGELDQDMLEQNDESDKPKYNLDKDQMQKLFNKS